MKPWPVLFSGLGVVRKPRGGGFDSQPGHMPGLWFSHQLGRVQEATD